MNQHIMNQQEFDLWAGSYDKSVGLSDQQNTYPFAGYRQVLNEIYRGVLSQPAKTVLDIGFGTGARHPLYPAPPGSVWFHRRCSIEIVVPILPRHGAPPPIQNAQNI